MGRGKIEIKRIENQNSRNVTFAKRKAGLMKKASEIAVLCEAKVSVIIIDHKGKIYSDCTPTTSLSDILDEYHKHSRDGIRLWDAKHENISGEIERVKKENENMNIKLKHLKGEDIQSLNHIELIANEDLLEDGLIRVREKKAEVMKHHRERSEILEAEHSRLHYELAQKELRGVGEMDNGGYHQHHQEMKEYNINSQMPFSFRVLPMQPNLQDMRM